MSLVIYSLIWQYCDVNEQNPPTKSSFPKKEPKFIHRSKLNTICSISINSPNKFESKRYQISIRSNNQSMSNYRAQIADGGDGAAPAAAAAEMKLVAVAVTGGGGTTGSGRGSRRAVRWAAENLFPKANRLLFIHVIPTITSIPTPSGKLVPIQGLDPNVVAMYVEDVKAQRQEVFMPFRRLCRGRKVETLVVEGDNPASTLLRYVSELGISSLVLGSCSTNWFIRKLKGPGVPSIVLKHAPDTCTMYVVSRHRLITNSANNTFASSRSRLYHRFFRRGSDPIRISLLETKVHSTSRGSTLSELAHSNSQALSCESASVQSTAVLGDAVLESQAVNRSASMSSARSEQSNLQSELEQLRVELKNTVDMYNQACEGLVHMKNKLYMLSSDCLEDVKRVNSAAEREENFRKIAAEERQKHLEAVKEIEMARSLLAKEAYEREMAELKALKESMEKQKITEAIFSNDRRYRRYTINEIEAATDFFSETKVIGEGAYGKVYKCYLDHTPVAIKVLWSDAAEKKREFLREVEVLSQLHHPHMVLLLGACPERGCLVYEFMENGSLEDFILRRNRISLPWYTRFRIIFEVACALAFLHNTKPEPTVHRDLKPGNILLDRNLVSKIGDVGLAKIITDLVPDSITEYRETILAGTLYYMDPEYHRTGIVRPKSDLYAFGIIVLQLLTSLSPNGILLTMETALARGSFSDILDVSVTDWPLAEAEELARIALKCCNLRCRDRPDLETEVLPVLKKLSDFADASRKVEKNNNDVPSHYYCPILQEIMVDPHVAADGFTYEHRAIKTWLERQHVSPVTKQRLPHKMLTPNHTLRSAIQEWRSRCTSSSN